MHICTFEMRYSGCSLVSQPVSSIDADISVIFAAAVGAMHPILDARVLSIHHVIRGNQNTR